VKRSFPLECVGQDRRMLVPWRRQPCGQLREAIENRVLAEGLRSGAGDQGWQLDPSAQRSSRLIHVRSVGKLLIAALRLGFVVLPEFLLPALSRAAALIGQAAPPLFQAVLADFMDKGHLSLHPTRARLIYAAFTMAGMPLALRSPKQAIAKATSSEPALQNQRWLRSPQRESMAK